LSHVVPEPLRGGILAMLDDGPASTRLRLAARFYDPTGRARPDRTTTRPAEPRADRTTSRAPETRSDRTSRPSETRSDRTTRPSESGSGVHRDLELETMHIACLRNMLLDASDAIRNVASYRIAELGLGQLEPELRALAAAPDGALAELTDKAMDLFEQRLLEVTNAG